MPPTCGLGREGTRRKTVARYSALSAGEATARPAGTLCAVKPRLACPRLQATMRPRYHACIPIQKITFGRCALPACAGSRSIAPTIGAPIIGSSRRIGRTTFACPISNRGSGARRAASVALISDRTSPMRLHRPGADRGEAGGSGRPSIPTIDTSPLPDSSPVYSRQGNELSEVGP